MEDSGQVRSIRPFGDRPSHGRAFVLVYGFLLIVIALVAMLDPLATGFAVGILLGAMLIFYGVFAVAAGFSAMPHSGRGIEIFLGALAILAAVALIFNPFAGAVSLVWVIGAWLILSGIFHVFYAASTPNDRGWRIFLGLVDIVLGGYLFFSGAATALIFLAFLVGISFLMRGVFLVILGSRLPGKIRS